MDNKSYEYRVYRNMHDSLKKEGQTEPSKKTMLFIKEHLYKNQRPWVEVVLAQVADGVAIDDAIKRANEAIQQAKNNA